MQLTNRKNFIYLLKIIAISLPVIFLWWLSIRYGVNVISREDVLVIDEFIDIITSGKIDWNIFFGRNNEHLIVFPKIIIFAIAYFTHYNTKIIMMVSPLLLSVIYFVFLRQTVGKKFSDFSLLDIVYALVTGFCLFSMMQYENLLWNFQLAWFLVEFCVVLGLVSLILYIQTGHRKYIYWAIVLAFISSFSSLQGLLIWPSYVAVLFLYQIEARCFDKKSWLFIIIPTIICYVGYFYDYQAILPEAKAKSFLQMITHVMNTQGSVIAYFTSEDPHSKCMNMWQCWNIITYFNDGKVPVFLGVLETILTVSLFVVLWLKKRISQNLFSLGLIIFSFGMAFMLAIGRAGYFFQTSRYMTCPLLLVVGNLAILKQFCCYKNWRSALSGVIFCSLAWLCISSSYHDFRTIKRFHEIEIIKANVLLNYKQVSFDHLLIFLWPFWTSHEYAVNHIEKIEKANLSVFYNNK